MPSRHGAIRASDGIHEVRIFVGERAEEFGLIDGVDGGGGADSEREGEDGEECNRFRAFPGSPAVQEKCEHARDCMITKRRVAGSFDAVPVSPLD